MSDWTIEQATELALEQFVYLLDGCDDDDTVRPAMVFEAMRKEWAPKGEFLWDKSITAREARVRLAALRGRLAAGETVP